MVILSKKIRRFLFNQLLKYGNVIPDKLYIEIQYYLYQGVKLNLNNPQTFTEKIQWLKLYYKKNILHNLVDKYEVKKYVANIIGDKHIIPTIIVWHNADDIDVNKLPEKFVLKCTHSSHTSIVCTNKSSFSVSNAKSKMKIWIKDSPYKKYREWAYKYVNPRIIAEKFMQDSNHKDLIDYKFFCFNGKAEYCQVIMNRSEAETIDYFDRNWTKQEFIGLNEKAKHADYLITQPLCYKEMLSIADKLSYGFPFVRVDLYDIEGSIYFGELTFYPGAGLGIFYPIHWNEKLGTLLSLPYESN